MDTLIIAQNLNLGYRNNKKSCLLRAGASWAEKCDGKTWIGV